MRVFDRVAAAVTLWAGSPTAVIGSVLIVVIWAFVGPIFQFSDTWQLVINTTTTILTFNMVFLIQATQNRDNKALHVKLDEIIESIDSASNRVVGAEEAEREEIEELHQEHLQIKEESDG